MPASIDTRKAHLVRQHGDLTVIFTWINDERAMVLVPTYRPGAPWFVVMDSAAYTWDDTDKGNIHLVIAKGSKACQVLGIDPNPHNVRRIVGIVMDGIPDLVRMPSAPPAEHYRSSFGRMELRADGHILAAEDIRLEKEGVSYA